MKYFTMYRPVEGEIKEGDIITDGKNICKCNSHDNVYLDCTAFFGVTPIENWKKVALHLCSRDIKVGDIVAPKGIQINVAGFTWTEYHAKEHNNNANGYYYKSIGRISPEATWVKEGMEFDEGEWLKEEGFFETVLIKFKCPTCNHFH